MLKQNKLIIAAAGAGKTTLLVRKALKIKNKNVLITTYTEANEAEIKKKIIEENHEEKIIPSNITIQTWFSFLLKHGVKPYQGAYNEKLFIREITGLDFCQNRSGCKNPNSKGSKYYWGEEENFEKFYFTSSYKIHSDKLSKFIIECNKRSNGDVINRIAKIYSHILIDEVQDLAGYDLEILKLLFASNINTILVGDPRQVTYLTHHERMNTEFKDGKIKEYINKKCKKLNCEIDETTLKYSHRNNKEICKFSSELFPNLPISEPCSCIECRQTVVSNNGIYIIRDNQINEYMELSPPPTVLRFDRSIYPEWNYGKSKGMTFDRVLIYPTKPIIRYLYDGSLTKMEKGKTKDAFDISKFYVALTRAKYSIAIIHNYSDNDIFIEGIKLWNKDEN